MLSHSGAVGTEALMGMLKNYCRSLNLKTAITVGVIGYPNVGKSSLINSLKRSKAVGVSATPGFTKSMQEVHLDKTVKLLDCPGIVFDDKDSESTLLKNCVDAESMSDPTPAVDAVLKRCAPEQLMQVYSIQRFDPADTPGFLALIARKVGKLRKGGVPDRIAAARLVLRDWNSGKVPFYTLPPEEEDAGGAAATAVAEAMFVEGFGKEFDAEAEEGDAKVLEALPERDPLEFVTVKAGVLSRGGWSEGPDAMEDEEGEGDEMDEMEDEEEDEEESDEDLAPLKTHCLGKSEDRSSAVTSVTEKGTTSAVKDVKGTPSPRQAMDAMLEEERAINPQTNKSLKKAHKAAKKKGRRAAKAEGGTGSSEQGSEGQNGDGDSYSFTRDFYGGSGVGQGTVGDDDDDDDL
ncbi:unnamed protein product [Choristocarpus tenellus]